MGFSQPDSGNCGAWLLGVAGDWVAEPDKVDNGRRSGRVGEASRAVGKSKWRMAGVGDRRVKALPVLLQLFTPHLGL